MDLPPTVIGTGGAQEEPLSVDQETRRVPRGVRMFLPRSHSHDGSAQNNAAKAVTRT